jgi:perosamine synthetase
VGRKYAVTTVNGTAALHTALLAVGVKPNDEVLVSALTFIAPANAVRYIGAWPVFVDAEPKYWQMDPEKYADFIEDKCSWIKGELRNKATGRRVRAILPVHILGHPVNMDPILEIAKKYELPVIEDAAESLGAKYRDCEVGALGDIGCFSFNGNKIITTGGGGMIVTDDGAMAQKCKYLTTQAKDDPVEYIHHHVGYNYRLSNVQAAMGCAQLEKLDEYTITKRRIAKDYSNALKNIPGITPMPEAPWAYSAFWLYTILVDNQYGCGDSRLLLKRLKEKDIETRPLWQPLHRNPVYRDSQTTDCSVSEQLFQQALSLPSSVGLSQQSQDYVISQIENFIKE